MPAPFVLSRPVRIVGVGSCLGAPIFGPAAGPRALRALGLDAQLRQRGIRARWETLLEPSAPKPPHPPMPDRLGLVSHLLHDLADTVAGICHDGAIPLVLGGDHAIGADAAVGTAQAALERSRAEVEAVRNSETFRLGRAVARPVAVVKRGVKKVLK